MSSSPSGSFKDEYARAICMKHAGQYFDKMLQSYQATRDFLAHPDPRARLGALTMMRDYWAPPPDFRQLSERMAREEQDPNVRCIALNCLIDFYYGTRDVRFGRWLASIVRDEAQPTLIRTVAYCFLFAVRGAEEFPRAHTLQFPEQVNWAFVDSFLEEGPQQ